MRVAILGAGGIGLASAAHLVAAGHQPVLWSTSGKGLVEIAAGGLQAKGALTSRVFPDVEPVLADATRDAEVLLVAVPATARRALFDALGPLLVPGQTVIVSAELSLGAHYLRRQVAAEGVGIAAWSTTAHTGRRLGAGEVEAGAPRRAVATAVLPASQAEMVLAQCTLLFGDRFHLVSPLAILLNNLNPEVHMANVLCNWTRIEKAEPWANYDGITPSVARLIEDLDKERLALAAACNVVVNSVKSHFGLSFGLPQDASLAQMAAEVHRRRGGPPGPISLSTRFIGEDLPFGIVPLVRLGELTGVEMLLHRAGLRLIDSLCATGHAAANDLLGGEDLEALLTAGRHRHR